MKLALLRIVFPVGLGLALAIASANSAFANNASVSFHGSTATYTDATDTLCAKATNDFPGLRDYAIAQILDVNTLATVATVVDNEGGSNSCTGNLSIPEDKRYFLVVFDCSEVPGTDCGGSPRVSFYS